MNTPKNDLQLVGVAAMWVASKYEEISTVEVAELVRLTDDSYTAEQVRHMECDILKVLDFQLNFPLQIQFLRRFTKAAGVGNDYYGAISSDRCSVFRHLCLRFKTWYCIAEMKFCAISFI